MERPVPEGGERLGLAVLVGFVALVFGPAIGGQPLDWDDPVWLGDPILELSLADAVGVAFTTTRDHVYAPLLRLSFWLQGRLLGGAVAMHVVSLVLWIGCVLGAHRLVRRLGVPALPALVAIGWWALHPTKVEVVAWLTALKDLQSLAFLLGMALVLIPAERRPTPARVAVGTLLGAGALLTKAAVFPIPFVLAAIVVLQTSDRPWTEALRRFGPVCALSIGAAAIGGSAWSADYLWPELSPYVLPLWVHGELWRHLLPTTPMAVVPVPENPVPIALAGLVLSGAFAAVAARWPKVGLPALLVWIVPQVPFLGVVPMAFWASDRHLLVPSLGVAVVAAIGLDRLLVGRARFLPFGLWLVFAAVSAGRVPEWHDSLTFWEAEVTRRGDHWARWYKLGVARGMAGRFADAEAAFDRSLALRPDHRTALAHRLIASLAADGWTDTDAALVPLLEPPPPTDRAWAEALLALDRAGEAELVAYAERYLRR